MQLSVKIDLFDYSLLAELVKPEVRHEIHRYIADHVWLTSPKISLGRDEDGILLIEFRGEHWRRSSRKNGLDSAEQDGAAPGRREADTGGRGPVRMAAHHIARQVALLVRMINPLADADARKSGGNDSRIGPARSDCCDESGASDASQPLPPVQVFSDARNLRHAAKAIPHLRSVQ
jgi:hypothetical protein